LLFHKSKDRAVIEECHMQPQQRRRKACFFWPGAASFCSPGWKPAADLYRTARGWLIKLDLAGIDPQEVSIKIDGQRLQIRGVRRDWSIEEACHYHSLEIAYSRFEREFDFPVDLGQARITTEYKTGMLLVRIQLEEERP
jgi:HSP20 family protein